eukprot:gene6672-8254_t
MTDKEMLSHEDLKNKGNDYFKKEQYSDAIKCYTQAIELSESSIASYFGNRAAAHMAIGTKGSYQDAITDSLKALELDPKFIKGYVRAAKSYVQLGRIDEGQSIIVRGLAVDPSNSELLQEKSNVQLLNTQINNLKESFKQNPSQLYVIEKILTQSKYNIPINMLKAKSLIASKQYSKASNLMTTFLQEDSRNPEYLYIRGLALYYQNNLTSAQQHFQNSLTFDPDYTESRIALKRLKSLESKKKEGNEAFSAKNYQQAYDLFTEALAIDPVFDIVNSQLYSNRAATLINLNKHSEAIKDCTSAIELDSNYGKAYIRRAQCYMKLEQFEDAVRDYEKAQTLDPENRDLHKTLKDAKIQLKKSLRKDYYKILGIGKDASDSEIKKAYRKLALQYHPDKNSTLPEEEKAHAEKMFKDIGEAYGILSDPNKKQRYDMGQDENGMPFDHEEMDPNHIFNMFMGGMGGGMGGMGGGMGGGFHPFFNMGGMGGMGGMDFGGMGGMGGMGGHSHGGGRSSKRPGAKTEFRWG